MSSSSADDKLLSRTEAAHRLGVSISTLERRIRSGELRVCKLGTSARATVKIKYSEVERFIAAGETNRNSEAA